MPKENEMVEDQVVKSPKVMKSPKARKISGKDSTKISTQPIESQNSGTPKRRKQTPETVEEVTQVRDNSETPPSKQKKSNEDPQSPKTKPKTSKSSGKLKSAKQNNSDVPENLYAESPALLNDPKVDTEMKSLKEEEEEGLYNATPNIVNKKKEGVDGFDMSVMYVWLGRFR